jgi:NitT/TauT family transport system substrate-binding protein
MKKIFLTLLTLLSTFSVGFSQTKMPFALDWKFEGPSAPYFYAIDNGYFKSEGLEVEISAGKGSLDAIPKVATGAFPVGFADINSLVKFLDKNPSAPVIAVMMVYDKPPFAIAGRKSLGVSSPKDLEGKILGAPPPDGAWAQFTPFAKANNLNVDKIKVEPVGFPTREPMLAESKVDAITGFSFSMFLNLIRLGVPEEDISVMLMANNGLKLYGNAIIVNKDFASANPDKVSSFLKAVGKGWASSIKDPEKAVKSLIERNPAADLVLETRRLKLAIEGNVLTPYTEKNGMGKIDMERMTAALAQIEQTYDFTSKAEISNFYTDKYLPTDESLKLK